MWNYDTGTSTTVGRSSPTPGLTVTTNDGADGGVATDYYTGYSPVMVNTATFDDLFASYLTGVSISTALIVAMNWI